IRGRAGLRGAGDGATRLQARERVVRIAAFDLVLATRDRRRAVRRAAARLARRRSARALLLLLVVARDALGARDLLGLGLLRLVLGDLGLELLFLAANLLALGLGRRIGELAIEIRLVALELVLLLLEAVELLGDRSELCVVLFLLLARELFLLLRLARVVP